MIIGALLPDLGSIEEIFNKLEISVGAEIGNYGYNRFFDDGDEVDELEVLNDIYSGTRYFVESVSANASGDYYKQTVNGRDYYLYITDGVAVPAGAERFDVTFSASQVREDAYYKEKTILVGEEKTEKTIYTLVLPLNERYAYYDEITWKDNNVDGRYAKVQVGEEDGVPQYEYFDTDRYALYTTTTDEVANHAKCIAVFK